jgi:carboxylate-amine ligase
VVRGGIFPYDVRSRGYRREAAASPLRVSPKEVADLSAGTGEYTLGVEEEYQIVDAESGGLEPRGGPVLDRARQALGEQVVSELRASQIEVVTSVCRTLAEVRAELAWLRRGVSGASCEEGCRIVAASTHPFSDWQEQPITSDRRYRRLVESYGRLIHQQLAFGFHVHVGLDDREAALGVMNHLRVWLAPLLALSANSPFWLGEDTGYASYRTQVWGRLPASGPPGPFASLAEHDALVEALVETGGVLDAASVYWDVRLPEKLETVEIRVADVPSRVDEAVMLTGLCRALVRVCHERVERGEPYPDARPELLRIAHWNASRYGLDGKLVDVEAQRVLPAHAMMEKMLAFARPALEEHGDYEEVSSLVGDTLDRGNGARRQRRAYERTGRLGGVIDALIEETASGTDAT